MCLSPKVKSETLREFTVFSPIARVFLFITTPVGRSCGNGEAGRAACYNSTRFPWKELVSFLCCFAGVILMQPRQGFIH